MPFSSIWSLLNSSGIVVDTLCQNKGILRGEKLIVDLFANKSLMLSKGDYATAIETMFATYRIDQVSMLPYARRRNKVKDVLGFLRGKTMIELLVQR